MKNTNKEELKVAMSKVFALMQTRLLNRYSYKFGAIGEDAADAMMVALDYVMKYMLDNPEEYSEDEFVRLMNLKMSCLLKDTAKAAKRSRGRRSVRSVPVLDVDTDDGENFRTSLIDRESMARNKHHLAEEDLRFDTKLRTKAIRIILNKDGVSRRDIDLFDRLVSGGVDQQGLAAEAGVSYSNLARIKCLCRGRLAKRLPELRACYLALREAAA